MLNTTLNPSEKVALKALTPNPTPQFNEPVENWVSRRTTYREGSWHKVIAAALIIGLLAGAWFFLRDYVVADETTSEPSADAGGVSEGPTLSDGAIRKLREKQSVEADDLKLEWLLIENEETGAPPNAFYGVKESDFGYWLDCVLDKELIRISRSLEEFKANNRVVIDTGGNTKFETIDQYVPDGLNNAVVEIPLDNRVFDELLNGSNLLRISVSDGASTEKMPNEPNLIKFITECRAAVSA